MDRRTANKHKIPLTFDNWNLRIDRKLSLMNKRRVPQKVIRIPVVENANISPKIQRKIGIITEPRRNEYLLDWFLFVYKIMKRRRDIDRKALNSEASWKRPKGLGILITDKGGIYSFLV